jgi:GrpB-like predicted nucleotidyltransferase (UPF0157 family)
MDIQPERYPVELVPHSPDWAKQAVTEMARLRRTIGEDILIGLHHIGSTAIPNILAKPTVDLMAVVTRHDALEARRARLEAIGYQWHGEFGLAGRRFLTLSTGEPRKRLFNLHCYEEGSPSILRHLALRDYLRAHPDKAKAYEAEKLRAQSVRPDDTTAYAEEKGAWIREVEREALAWYRP